MAATSEDREPVTSEDRGPATSEDREPVTSEDRGPATSEDREPATSEDREPATSEDREPGPRQHSQRLSSSPWRLSRKILVKTQNFVVQTKRTESILLQIAFSLGLGSTWRFPYLCHRNGGDFILIYCLLLCLLGVPLLYMEMVMGQWLRLGSIQIWRHLVTLMGGLGYASVLMCVLVSVYNSIIITWCFYYLTNSFHHPLPWTRCPLPHTNVTGLSCLRTVSEQHFWYEVVLSASAHIQEEDKHLLLHLTLGTLATWCLLFVILVSGLKLSTPLLIFTIFLPSFFFIGLLIHCLFLEGAAASLKRMVTLKHTSWASPDLWHQAVGHVLYSLGLGLGTTVNISSSMASSDSFVAVVLCVAVVTLAASLVATAIVFAVAGHWVGTSGPACVEKSIHAVNQLIKRGLLPQDVNPPAGTLAPLDYLTWVSSLPEHLRFQVIQAAPSCSIEALSGEFMQGPGLAFPAFSEAVAMLPGAPFWAFVLFLTLAVIQLTTLVKVVESIVFPLHSVISSLKRLPLMFPVAVCLGGFLGSLVFTSKAGSYIMSLLDETLVPLTLVVIVLLQNVTLAWIYGATRFREMYGDLGRLLWSSCPFLWCYVTMPALLVLLAFCLIRLYGRVPPSYIAWNSSTGREMEQPYLPSALGWITFLGVLVLLPIPIYPLQHWWHLQERIASHPFEKLLAKKSARPSDWPKFRERSENSVVVRPSALTAVAVGEADEKPEWLEELPWRRQTESYSGFSLPFLPSVPSSASLSLPATPQASAATWAPSKA